MRLRKKKVAIVEYLLKTEAKPSYYIRRSFETTSRKSLQTIKHRIKHLSYSNNKLINLIYSIYCTKAGQIQPIGSVYTMLLRKKKLRSLNTNHGKISPYPPSQKISPYKKKIRVFPNNKYYMLTNSKLYNLQPFLRGCGGLKCIVIGHSEYVKSHKYLKILVKRL